MTRRVPPEDKNQKAVTVEGREYRAQRDGFFHVENDRHADAILRAGGYGRSWQVAPPPRASSGYRCTECRRLGFFVVCGRCGSATVKE